jgi:hypothetical protein
VEVGSSGIWLRGIGAFAWSELTEVRHETFVGPAGRSGLRRYERLSVVPIDQNRKGPRSARAGIALANAYYGAILPAIGRAAVQLAPLGLMADEINDFQVLLDIVRKYTTLKEIA